MSLIHKNIIIQPNVGQVADPVITFSGADASTTAQDIRLLTYPQAGGTLSFEGTAGQLLSISNNMSGTIYSVNDISGIPSIEVLDTGLIKLGQYSGNVLIGKATDDGTNKLQITGSANISGQVACGSFNSPTGVFTTSVTTPLLTNNLGAIDITPTAGTNINLNITGAGFVKAATVCLNKYGIDRSGLNFHHTTSNTWQMYMANSGTASNGSLANITAPTGTVVSAWALRSVIENNTGYGWTWESMVNNSTATQSNPTLIAELSSINGNFKTIGTITGTNISGANLTASSYVTAAIWRNVYDTSHLWDVQTSSTGVMGFNYWNGSIWFSNTLQLNAAGGAFLNGTGAAGNIPYVSFRTNGVQYGVVGLYGAITGSTETDVVLSSETGKSIFFCPNGSVSKVMTLASTGASLSVTAGVTQADIKSSSANNLLTLQSVYGTGVGYAQGIVFTSSDNGVGKPKAGIYSRFSGAGSYLYMGTSNSYGTGITNDALIIDYNGDITLKNISASSLAVGTSSITCGTLSASTSVTTPLLTNTGNVNITPASANHINMNVSGGGMVMMPAGSAINFGTGDMFGGDNASLYAYINSAAKLTINATGATFADNVIVGGNLTVNGTTTTVNSNTVTIDDPIFTIGGDTAPTIDDNKDRGIEYRWHNGTAAKVGFFGYDDSVGVFTFIPDATNTSEVFSGTQGVIQVSNYGATASTGIQPYACNSTTVNANLNADMVDGAHTDTAYNSYGNSTIPIRHVNGYLFSNYFNCTADITVGAPTHIAIQTGSDNYIRWQTAAQFKTSLGTMPPSTHTHAALSFGAGITASPNQAYDGSTAITIVHADTSTLATLNASARTYVTGLTFDTYGHVTALTTAAETVVNTDTITRLRGTASGTYNSGDLTLLAGTGISISQATNDYTITCTVTDTNTWIPNALNVAGYVAAPSAGNGNHFWLCDASGNPAWRAIPTLNQNTSGTARMLTCPDGIGGVRDFTDKLPTTYPNAVRFDFITASAMGGGIGSYAGVMTYAPWTGTAASTGDCSYQLAFASTIANSGVPVLKIRNGIDSTWNTWNTIVHTGSSLTSAQVATIVSDETGTDKLVFNTNPNLLAPTINTNVVLDSTSAVIAAATTTAMMAVPIATWRGGDVIITIAQGTNVMITKFLWVHDGTNIEWTEYGMLTRGTLSGISISFDINAGNARCLVTTANATSTVMRISTTTLK